MAEIANNHFFRQKWTMELFNSTILSDIWPELIVFTSWAAMVTLVTELTPANLAISSQLLTVAGIVMALVVSFRTSSAYERYQEGNKMWTNIRTQSRILGQQIWCHVLDDRQDGEKNPIPPLHVIMEKKTMIQLIHAFAVSVKHLLRDEPGVFYEDLYPYVAFLPRFATDANHAHDILPLWHVDGGRLMKPVMPDRKDTLLELVIQKDPPLKPAQMPPEFSIFDYFGILKLPRYMFRKFLLKAHLRDEKGPKRPKKRIAYSKVVESTVPLELHSILSGYAAFLMTNGYVNLTIASAMTTSLNGLQDALANLDRICNNPIPFGYQVHLRVCLWIYLLLLPFQIVGDFHYITIPAMTFVAFLFTGLLEIGQEIANPFNYGMNDLDLDRYCNLIRRNLAEITAHPNWEPEDFMYDNRNQPFAPMDKRGADEIRKVGAGEYVPVESPNGKSGVDGVRRVLIQNWKQVDLVTRRPLDLS